MADFLYTYAGMYLAQSLCHSAVAAAVADSSLLAWRIMDPKVKQRFRLIVIVAPVVSFPLYQLINPARGSIQFRLDALFDVNRWFFLEVFGLFTIWTATLVIIVLTALIFLVQELIPIVLHLMEVRREGTAEEASGPTEGAHESAMRILEGLSMDSVGLHVLEDEELILFSSTGRTPEVFLSTGMMEEMTPLELKAAVAHELAHIKRSKTPLLMTVYLVRMLMFFNPITLIEFRKVAQEEEKICDDMAVEMTGDRESLARAVERMRPDMDEFSNGGAADFSARASVVELHSHDMQLKTRMNRLRDPFEHMEPGGGWLQFALTLAAALAVNYFVV